MSTIRRAYFYAVSLVTEALWAWGAGILLKLMLDEAIVGQTTLTRSSSYPAQQLALGLSLLVIPGAVWLLHWRTVQRHAAGDAKESGSALRKLYLSAILTASALTALMTSITVLRWLLGGAHIQSLPTGSLSAMLVALGIWYYNQQTDAGDAVPSATGKTLHRWYLYVTSSWSLAILSIGIVNLLAVMFDWAFADAALAQNPFWGDQTQLRVASVLLGALWWAFHWFRLARGDYGSTLRHVYLYLFAIFGGAVTALVSLTIILFNLVKLTANAFHAGSVSNHYLVWTIPATIVGAAVWSYHWLAAKEESSTFEELRSAAKRVYYYLLSGLGLVELAAGIAFLIGLLLDLLLNALDQSAVMVSTSGWWQGQIALFLALLIVGLAVWSHFWTRVQLDASTTAGERIVRSRKIYLYTFLCLSVVALVAGLVNILYKLVGAFLGASTYFVALTDMKWGLQIVIVAVPILLYHLDLMRQDMRAGSESRTQVRDVVAVLDQELAESVVPSLEAILGYHVRLLALEGASVIGPPTGTVTEDTLKILAGTISSSPASKLLLLAQDGKLVIYPYEERKK